MPQPGCTPLRIIHPVLDLSLSLAIREWGQANGYPVSERGRIAKEIVEAFLAAHPGAYEQARKFELVRATARTPGPSPEDFTWLPGEIYTIVFARGLDEHETLRRSSAPPRFLTSLEAGLLPAPLGAWLDATVPRDGGGRADGP